MISALRPFIIQALIWMPLPSGTNAALGMSDMSAIRFELLGIKTHQFSLQLFNASNQTTKHNRTRPNTIKQQATMCTKDQSTKIYTCGDRVTEDSNFKPCSKQSEPGHTVTINTLGSSRQKGKCGRYGCTNP
ncbi:hypothetical protein LX32DRAFT_251230 [Colletotrichum zoysiae]|uniref:Secreted protein n=1 Tax=Colletotrichum zoysiae TaxID=1216348 RepID=A0AAD9H2Y4_9PEZI|nr:hypothetical protein LX32DRAFT_251230 [Colletotrichum zoysiae]